MTFYQIGWIFFHLTSKYILSLVIAKSNLQKSADQFSAEIDQLIFGN